MKPSQTTLMDDSSIPTDRRAFLVASGALLGGTLISRSQAVEVPNKGGMIINSQILDHDTALGPCGSLAGFGPDTGTLFEAGDRRIQWHYDMQSQISVVTDSGRAPSNGPHRMAIVHVLATARIYFGEGKGESVALAGLEWALDPVSVAFVAERRGDKIEIIGPVGRLTSSRLGMQVGLDFRVEEIEDGQATDYSDPGNFRSYPPLHGVSVSFDALEPDFSGFDLERAFRKLEKQMQLAPDSLTRTNPLGTANGMHRIRFFAVNP